MAVDGAIDFHPAEACSAPVDVTRAFVALVIGGFSSTADTITMTPKLCLPLDFYHYLYTTTRNGAQVPLLPPEALVEGLPPRETETESRLAESAIPKRDLELQIAVSWTPIAPGGGGVTETPRPVELSSPETSYRSATIRHLLPERDVPTERVVTLSQFVVPLIATPQRYPVDWYAVSGEIGVSAPNLYSVYYCPRITKYAIGCSQGLPTRVVVLREPSLSQFVVEASARAAPVFSRGYGTILTIRLHRTATTAVYVLVILLIPLVLGLLLSVVFSMRRRTGDPVGPEGIAGVAAVLLAILPIRLVLVPGEIGSLTLVDYWLGFEMALLAALACRAVWMSLRMAKASPVHDRQARGAG